MPITKTQAVVKEILELLETLDEYQRRDIMVYLADTYCVHCWRQTDGARCYCLADE